MAAPRSKPAQTPGDGAPEDTAPAPAPAPAATVRLALRPPYDTFVLGHGLPDLTVDGTDYAPSDTDTVYALARQYGVPVVDATPEPPAPPAPAADTSTAKEA